jgi:small conductance mechanosensitive channel
VFFVALYGLFSIWNIDIAPLLASAGIIGVVVGIGSRSIFEDVFAGVFLVSQSRVAQGDYVVLGNGIEGVVESVGIKNTTLISNSGAYTIVPNGQIKHVTNNAFGLARILLDIPVKVGQNPDTILSVFESVLNTFFTDEEYRIKRISKVIGINKIDRAYMVTVMLVTEGSLRGKIEPVFNYRLIKSFDRRRLKFADSTL